MASSMAVGLSTELSTWSNTLKAHGRIFVCIRIFVHGAITPKERRQMEDVPRKTRIGGNEKVERSEKVERRD